MSVFNQTDPPLEDPLNHRLSYVITDVRKRHKRDHDKAWKCEEKRSSKEHRKAKGHRREWSPENSNDGSAALNLSDGKKTKHTHNHPG